MLGVASRRKVDEMISQGRILVNGHAVTLGDKVNPQKDEIIIDGIIIDKKVPSYLYCPSQAGRLHLVYD